MKINFIFLRWNFIASTGNAMIDKMLRKCVSSKLLIADRRFQKRKES